MAVIIWSNDDVGWGKWCRAHPNAFMANTGNPPHRRYFLIHCTSHHLPDRSNGVTLQPRTGNMYTKVTAESVAELIQWASDTIEGFGPSDVRYCKTCNPLSSSSKSSAPTADPELYRTRADSLLAKGKITRPVGSKNPKVVVGTSSAYERDPKVRAWVLQRAQGRCECCLCDAPFCTDGGIPFLETHHIDSLAQGGPDTPENTAAVCPNCHRRIHHGMDRKQLTTKVRKLVLAAERKQ
jgi:5-methylcytosine-specific restriction endonuclease McrA